MATGILGQSSVLAYSLDDSSYTEIGNVTSVSGPTTSADQIEVTNMSSVGGYRQYIAGLIEPGEMTIGMNLDPSNTGHKAMFTYLEDRANTTIYWRLTFTDAEIIKFVGVVTGAEVNNPIDGPITLNVTVKVTGNVDWPGSA